MIYTVTPDTPAVLGVGGVDAILQNIALLLRTRKGDCPGFRKFGLPKEYLGLPIQAAIGVFRNELRDALQDFDITVQIISIRGEIAPNGDFCPVVEVEIT